MATSISVRQIRLPTVSYGPFRFLEAVPWLMFAAAMRLVAYRGGAPALPALILANFALFDGDSHLCLARVLSPRAK